MARMARAAVSERRMVSPRETGVKPAWWKAAYSAGEKSPSGPMASQMGVEGGRSVFCKTSAMGRAFFSRLATMRREGSGKG